MNDAQPIVPALIYRPINLLFGLLLVGFLWSSGASVAARQPPLHVMVLGDSITAGYGVAAEDSLPAQLKRRMIADGYDVDVVNAGVPGDTTAMGLARLDRALSAGPVDLAIIELGINDMGHGIDPKEVWANLEQIIATLQANGVKVLLTTTVSYDRNGGAYKQEFDSIYPELAEKYGLTLVPFILEGIWGNAALTNDTLDPNATGVAEIINKIAPCVEKALPSPTAKKAQ